MFVKDKNVNDEINIINVEHICYINYSCLANGYCVAHMMNGDEVYVSKKFVEWFNKEKVIEI